LSAASAGCEAQRAEQPADDHPQRLSRARSVLDNKGSNTRIGRPAMNRKVVYALFFMMSLVLLAGCGGGGGSGSSTGTVSLDIADAKPFIDAAEQPVELWIVFDAALVYTSGGRWVPPDLRQTPIAINLLAFYDGRTTGRRTW